MEEPNNHQILALEVFNQLKEGVAPASISSFWSSMNHEEKEAFASTLFEEGKHLILKGCDFAFNVFDLMRRIAPLSAKMHFKQGVFLFDYGVHKSGEKYLLSAQKYIQNAIELKNKSVDAWTIWGDILVHLGLMKKEMTFFQKANEKYQRAFEMARDKPKYLKKFLWDWALCWYFLGRHSGEAVDIKNAIERFEKAASLGCSQENFWRDFGNAYVSMGLLIDDKRFLLKALSCFQKALQIKPTYYKGWLSSANTFQKLYELTYNEDYLAQAHSAYGKAADLERDHEALWINWGHLFLLSGLSKEDDKHLQMAIMKFEKALELSPKHVEALSALSESYAALGYCNSNLEALKNSEIKINAALQIDPNNFKLLYRKGYSSFMQGRYFDDSSYYLEAIEYYKKSLEINPTYYKAHFSLGMVHLALGNQHQDEEHYIAAHSYLRKASDINKNDPELWNQWGMTHLRLAELLDDQENIAQAVSKFEKALSFYSKSNPPALLLFNYGCSLDFLGNYTEDVKDYEKAAEILNILIKLYPDYGCVYFNLALVYTHLGEMLHEVDYYGKALEAFHKAIQDDPEDSAIWKEWAITLMQYAMLINDPLKSEFFIALLDEANKKLRKSLSLGSLESYYHLACVYSLKGNLAESLHFLQLAKSKNVLPDIEEIAYDPRLEALRNFELYHQFIQSTPLKERFEDI